jgi:hypothetical protein
LQNLLQIELGSILKLCLLNNKKYLREGVRTWKLRRQLCLGFQVFLETSHKQMKNSPSKKKLALI